MLRCGTVLLAFAMMAVTSVGAVAQQTTTPPPPDQVLFKPEQLEALVAPIALYPDELLANVLAASTYPLEVVQADRWLRERAALKGDALKKEVDKQSWDDSVKALASTPDVIALMSDKLDWTKGLGDAVLAQQPDVMDAIQRLRTKAYDNKKLATTKQQKVSVQTQESKQAIVIEPADPETMYVPYYEPAAVYGDWPYADYPAAYFAYPSYIGAGVIAAGLAFGAGWAIGRWGNYWGGGCNWGSRNLYVNHYNRTNNIGNNWQHNPAHRQGVQYNAGVQQKFGNNNLRAGAADRMDHRGREGLDAAKDRPGAGDRGGADRPGAGDRAKAADRSGDRAKTSDRAKGGDRAKSASGDRAKSTAGNRAASAGNRGGRDTAIGNVSSGRAANLQSARGRESFASASAGAARGGGGFQGGGGGLAGGGGRGGGGFAGGGGGRGGGGGGGGRRSDIALKHDVSLLGVLDNGLGYYRFSYLGSAKAYVGVIAQEVQRVMPSAVTRGADGYLRVDYRSLGIRFLTYRDWLAARAPIPARTGM